MLYSWVLILKISPKMLLFFHSSIERPSVVGRAVILLAKNTFLAAFVKKRTEVFGFFSRNVTFPIAQRLSQILRSVSTNACGWFICFLLRCTSKVVNDVPCPRGLLKVFGKPKFLRRAGDTFPQFSALTFHVRHPNNCKTNEYEILVTCCL